MKYLTLRHIEDAIADLARVHPFFLITFFAAKRAKLPVGTTATIRLDAVTDEFLNRHFHLHPKSKCYFKPYRGANKARVWVNPDYASSGLQTSNTQTFNDALEHPPKSRQWGWKPDYVSILKRHLPHQRRIPLWPIAVWIYRDTPLEDSTEPSDLVQRLVRDFALTQGERQELFEETVPLPSMNMFQATPVEWNEIIAPYPSPKDVSPDRGGVLSYLETTGVGPISRLIFRPGSRLNLITGDNSLGKTFLLDIVWWALTGSWVGQPAIAYPSKRKRAPAPSITYQLAATFRSVAQKSTFSFDTFTWSTRAKDAVLPGLVVYARADGSYAVWDPTRIASGNDRGPLLLTRDHVWSGQTDRIEGVMRDWLRWKSTAPNSPFDLFVKVLARISPPETGTLVPGAPVHLPFLPYEVPTIAHSYGDVAILHESAGVRRMISLAYLIVWAWQQHRQNAEFLRRAPERQLVVLIDELEAHLHPRWQRSILPALLGVFNDLSSELNSQVIVASHSPLVLASAEPVFRAEIDKLHTLDTTSEGEVIFEELPFIARGRVDEWLRSRAFGRTEPRSVPASDAIGRAKSLQEADAVNAADVAQVHAALVNSVPSGDTFWARWVLFARRHGVEV